MQLTYKYCVHTYIKVYNTSTCIKISENKPSLYIIQLKNKCNKTNIKHSMFTYK